MCYPLLFQYSDSGWKPNIPHVNIHRTARSVTTQFQYYCYRLVVKGFIIVLIIVIAVKGTFNLIYYSGKLFQQYPVGSYVKVEVPLRAENYKG